MGPPKDLVTSDVTDTSFVASWTAAPGHVKTYRVQWESPFSQETGETAVPGDVTSAVLQGLTPETLYQVSVVAAYDHKDSEPLTGQETTDGKTPADAQRCTRFQPHRHSSQLYFCPMCFYTLVMKCWKTQPGEASAFSQPGTIVPNILTLTPLSSEGVKALMSRTLQYDAPVDTTSDRPS